MARGPISNLIDQSMRTPEERSRIGRMGAAKANETKRRKKKTKELIQMILSMEPSVPEKTKKALEQMGYDFKNNSNPTVDLLIQIVQARNAMSGDLNAAEFMYRYGQVPDMKAQLQREQMKVEKEKIRGSLGIQNKAVDNMATIANLINAPVPDVDIETAQEEAAIQMANAVGDNDSEDEIEE